MRLDPKRESEALAGVDLEAVNANIGIGGWYSASDTCDDEEVYAIIMDARHVYRWTEAESDRRLALAGWRRNP